MDEVTHEVSQRLLLWNLRIIRNLYNWIEI